MKSKYVDLVAGIVVVGFAIFLFVASLGMKSLIAAKIEPQFVPRLTSYALFLLGAGIIARWVWMKRKGTLPADEQQKKEKSGLLSQITPVASFVFLFLYLFFLKRIGFTLSTALYLIFQINLLSAIFTWKEILKNTFIGVACAVITFLIFYRGFMLALPVGPWGF